ncbi:MAG: MerC domain-containing protein [Bacteroidota bacterium]|nr:MerC domain-containing protein [Bacteroidota bacterium]MDE2833955.1 MerC domain-containing protein [Bacteroidota bacterium]MDE2957099.1 MerC domain-containing protein [Bacteroidota bacterium]
MLTGITRPPVDAAGIILSTLCFLHCLAVPLVATGMLAWVASEAIHIGLTIALAGIVILVAWPSYQKHGRAVVPALLAGGLGLLLFAVIGEDSLGANATTSLTLLGSVVVVLGHILNLRYRRECR